MTEKPETGKVTARRHKGDKSAIVPKPRGPRRSPFDVEGLNKGLTKKEIVDAIRESRERA